MANEVGTNSPVFLQPASVLEFLAWVALELPPVSLKPSERDSSHSVWTNPGDLDLLRRTSKVAERTYRSWTDFCTGERSVFPLYDVRGDAFFSRSIVGVPPPGSSGLCSAVRSAAPASRRKSYRDLDAVSPAAVAAESSPFRATTARDADPALQGVRVSSDLFPVPPLRPAEGGPPSGSFSDYVLSADELGRIPGFCAPWGPQSVVLSPSEPCLER